MQQNIEAGSAAASYDLHAVNAASRPAATAPARQLSRLRKLTLGMGDFGFNLYWHVTSLFLLFFFTDVLGLPANVAGLIYMAALVWDAAIDPLVGLLADRTRTRFGRYRPYLMFGAIPLATVFTATFATPIAPNAGSIALATAAHLLFRTLYGVVSIPYTSLFARVTHDANERADLAGVRTVLGSISAVLISAFTLPIVHALAGDDPRRGWFLMGAASAALATLVIWVVAWAARGLDEPEVKSAAPHYPLSEVLRSLRANRALHIATSVIMVASLTTVFFSKNIIYYFKYVVGDASRASTALGLMALGTAAMVPACAWAAHRLGKRPVWMCGFGFTLAGLITWALADGHGTLPLYGALGLVSIGSAASYFSFWAAAPDTVEYGEWRTGVRAESVLFGVIVLGQKAALGIGAGVLGWALSAVGYTANVQQSPQTIAGLKTIMLIVPAMGAITALVLLCFYPLDSASHRRMVLEIAARKKRTADAALQDR